MEKITELIDLELDSEELVVNGEISYECKHDCKHNSWQLPGMKELGCETTYGMMWNPFA